MKNFRILAPLVASAGLIGLFALPVAPSFAQGLEEITVTATRRVQNPSSTFWTSLSLK